MLLLHTQKPFFFWNAPNPPYSGSWRPFFAFLMILLRQDKDVEKFPPQDRTQATIACGLRLPRFTPPFRLL